MKYNTYYYYSPVGVLEYRTKDDGLISLDIAQCKNFKNDKETEFSKSVKIQLDEYFSHNRKEFDLKLNPFGTDFQKKVWLQLLKIPYGKTATYGQIAKNLGNSKAFRAVGSACNKNPLLIIIPCHRIISQNNKLTGYRAGLNIKKYLLDFEHSEPISDFQAAYEG